MSVDSFQVDDQLNLILELAHQAQDQFVFEDVARQMNILRVRNFSLTMR